MDSHPGEYRSGDYAGKTGIEAAREKDLRGEKGYHIFLRNSKNQIEQPYKDGEFDKEAVPGHDIVTTIDAKLQQYGQELMKNKVGAIVAIEPGTGEILSLVSSPGIDVNQLADIGKYYQEILADPYRPMYNRAVQASYPPGSVFKLVNGLVGLEEGVLRPEMMYPCNHGYHFGAGHKLGCHGHKSPLNMEESIMMSCNAYYCYVLKNILDNRKFEGGTPPRSSPCPSARARSSPRRCTWRTCVRRSRTAATTTFPTSSRLRKVWRSTRSTTRSSTRRCPWSTSRR